MIIVVDKTIGQLNDPLFHIFAHLQHLKNDEKHSYLFLCNNGRILTFGKLPFVHIHSM